MTTGRINQVICVGLCVHTLCWWVRGTEALARKFRLVALNCFVSPLLSTRVRLLEGNHSGWRRGRARAKLLWCRNATIPHAPRPAIERAACVSQSSAGGRRPKALVGVLGSPAKQMAFGALSPGRVSTAGNAYWRAG
ncbi:hypothetical protein XU18_3139 [Perkinsela sp. CCAP 1560/4]|nr:hypothetical protein XU18_3139 [Perkinsela sp. CCAP 1560/4]|eukprot:KNH05977.1 hypothetical protein XU18_3139 [Perkinsela sp. CCAP 1560/4]